MTSEAFEKLKQQQRHALKAGDFFTLNKINKILFEEREKRQKAREEARQREQERALSAKIDTACDFLR